MAIKLGTTDIADIELGTVDVNKVYLGATQVWPTAVAFPVVASFNGEHGTSLGANNAIPSPSGIVAGNLLLAFAANDSPGTTELTGSVGWTRLHQQTQGANIIRAAVFGRIADGGANDAFALSGAAQDYACTIVRVTGHAVTDVLWSIKVASAVGGSGNADPPSLDATMSQSWLWMTAAIIDLNTSTANQLSADPANYTNVETRTSAASASSVAQRVARRDLATQTENPGPFTNTSRPWIAITLAIPSVTVPVQVPSAPAAPLGASGNGQVSLTWTAPASNGAPITDYVVQYAPSPPGTSWTTFSEGTSATPAATVTGLTNGQAYVFRVAAVNSAGQGAFSAASGTVTPNPPGSWTIVRQNNGAQTSTAVVVSLGAPTTGNTVIIACSSGDFPNGDPAGFTRDRFENADHTVAIWRKAVSTGETSWTIPCAFGTVPTCWWVAEIDGLTGAVDQVNGTIGTANTTSRNTGNITTLTANDLLIAVFGGDGTAAAWSGHTDSFVEEREQASGNVSLSVALRAVTGTGTYTCTATSTPASKNGGVIAAFPIG